MRLLDTKSLRVIEFNSDEVPSYAILSHTWGDEEVTYQDLNPQQDQIYTQLKSFKDSLLTKSGYRFSSQVTTKQGFRKLQQSAKQALSDGHTFMWIDTCCIDKSSSAELSEAINSMYQWYQNASICYAFLSDVSVTGNIEIVEQDALIRKSRWFTRGWTLQELIAPNDVQFYSAEWTLLGSKVGLQEPFAVSNILGPRILGEITGIDERVLDGGMDLQEESVATRMSWAARRHTTRVEDRAYCLLGIFSVNMPLLYGEGSRAFIRLQEAIMKETDDQSIFAWTAANADAEKKILSGLLADSPASFHKSIGIRPLPPVLSGETQPTTISSQGVNIKLFLRPVLKDETLESSENFHAILDCSRKIQGVETCPAIYLKKLWGNQYARIFPDAIMFLKPPGLAAPSPEERYNVVNVRQRPFYLVPDFNVHLDFLGPYHVSDVYPRSHWDSSAWVLKSAFARIGGVMGIVEVEDSRSWGTSRRLTVVVGIEGSGGEYKPWCVLVQRPENQPLIGLFETADKQERKGMLHRNKFPSSIGISAARVFEIIRHGRRFITLTVEDIPELGSYHLERHPRFTLKPVREVPGSAYAARKLATALQPATIEDFGASSMLKGSFMGNRAVRIRPMEQILSYTSDLLQGVPHEIECDLEDRGLDMGYTAAVRLLELCRDGELDMVQAMGSLDGLLQVKTTNFFNFTPVHWAVFGGHVELTKYLLQQGATIMPDTVFGSHTTEFAPVHLIAILGQHALLEIVQSYVAIDLRWLEITIPPYLDSLLHLAVVSDQFSEKLLRQLSNIETLNTLEYQKNVLGEGLMHRAAATRNIKALAFLLEIFRKNIQPVLDDFLNNKQTSCPQIDDSILFDLCHRSVIWHAAASGFGDGILLIHEKMDFVSGYLDRSDDTGVSPMHIACRQGHEKVVETLLSLGAKADGCTSIGLTPAHFAAFFGHAGCLDKILDHGGQMDSPSIHLQGLRPLHLAALRGQLECVKVLNRSGANPSSLAYVVFNTEKRWWDDEGDFDDMEWTELDSPMTAMDMAVQNGHRHVAHELNFPRR
ncbi:Vegetative incompatibility protein HET-E-1 [Colletotrichum siamense]|uniref:Vegetative incompatibility protein HET-E-1 n=1 Tax=Colletotrichum siamense TaxID=690259 RepID=A0A9P5EN25_COLSI|nr:Vegetative incompatibility protein HET-E-1 [Colletotrichum siamense]KAF4854717.1 Vegetative incompatibility protein HET-E-1 [Colletotrichum siamense]